jgi:PAS domain-containing protein
VVLVAAADDAEMPGVERIAPADLGPALLERCVRHALARARWREDVHGAEQRFRRILEDSPDPVLVQRRGVVLFVNPAATRYLGYGKAFELVGRPVGEVVHQDELADRGRGSASTSIAACPDAR